MKKLFISAIAMLILLAGCSLDSPLEKNDKDKSNKKNLKLSLALVYLR